MFTCEQLSVLDAALMPAYFVEKELWQAMMNIFNLAAGSAIFSL